MYHRQVVIEGNLVRDPEQVPISSDNTMAKFSIAVNRYYKNAQSEMIDEVMYIMVQAWGVLAKSCLQYLQKGRGVRVVGRLRQERWADKDGTNRERIVVVAEHVEFKSDGSVKQPDEEIAFDGEVSF